MREEDARERKAGVHSTTSTYTARKDSPAREPSWSAFWLQKPSILRVCVRDEDAGGRDTRRMDGFCNQNADQLGSLAGLSFPAVYVDVVECAPAFLPPASSSLTHTHRMDGLCNQNDLLGSLAGLSFPVVYVDVVECAPASPYTYSSTHRFPDERTRF